MIDTANTKKLRKISNYSLAVTIRTHAPQIQSWRSSPGADVCWNIEPLGFKH